MKKVFTLIMVVAFTLTLNAQNELGEGPKATNYKEVLKEIEYPKVCREKGIEGRVVVALEINKEGKVMGYEFLASPCSDLRVAVESSLSKLIFQPATDVNGKAVDGKITLPVNFQLSI